MNKAQPPEKLNTSSLLTAESLTIGYGVKVVAKEIAFTLSPGEILILLGPNGCGKSTLLKTLSGELLPLSGKVSILGREISEMSPKERAHFMSLVTTKRVVNARMTVDELVTLGRYPHMNFLLQEREEDRAAIEHAMELTGITEMRDSFVDTLSDGQLQRVMIARSLCQETPLILLDEPASFLDLHFQIRLMELLSKAAKEEGKGLVIALHDTRQAALLADQMICFTKDGVRLLTNPKEELSEDLIREMYSLEASPYDSLWR